MTAPGYRLVPEEPTREMLEAGVNKALTVSLGGDYRWRDYMADLWAAMLAAAPPPETPADLVERAWDHMKKASKNGWLFTQSSHVAEAFVAFAQEHAAAENKRIRDDALAALMDAEHDLCEARLDLAAEKARADELQRKLNLLDYGTVEQQIADVVSRMGDDIDHWKARADEADEALVALFDAAECIKHWHDAMKDGSGMVVSAEHVRALWSVTDSVRSSVAAIRARKGGGDEN